MLCYVTQLTGLGALLNGLSSNVSQMHHLTPGHGITKVLYCQVSVFKHERSF